MSDINLPSLIAKLDAQAQAVLEQALAQALQFQQSNATLAHVLYQLLSVEDQAARAELLHYIEKQARGDVDVPTLSQSVIDLIGEAWLLASLQYQQRFITNQVLLLAALSDSSLKQQVQAMSPSLAAYELSELRQQIAKAQPKAMTSNAASSALWEYTTDLTELATKGEIDPMIGREAELRQTLDILLRRRQNNPILLGDPGVGKTAIVEGLALRISQQDVPEFLRGMRVLALELASLTAGASVKGEFERRLTCLVDEVQASPEPILLFIDEAHTLISGQGEHSAAANILKPLLARGKLRTIAATTWREYKLHIEKDPALVRRFQAVKIAEPSIEQAKAMVRAIVPSLEKHHQVMITQQAVAASCELSARFLAERLLPDKAISCLDTACARLASRGQMEPLDISLLNEQQRILQTQLEQSQREPELDVAAIEQEIQQLEQQLISTQEQDATKAEVTAQDIADVLSAWTGIPAANMLATTQERLLQLPVTLSQRVVGQSHALAEIARTLQLSASQLQDSNKPLGVFLLAGPSGVGKTETALALSEAIYGSEDKLITINMSEFKEPHRVATLTGSPPGYVGYGEGGVLTEAVRRQPYSLVLLDEMEKAHPSVQDIFYRVLDKGILRDSEGRDVDFRNTIIIMTSNAADQFVAAQDQELDLLDAEFQSAFSDELGRHFKKAFLGRVQALAYRALSEENMLALMQSKVDGLQQRVKQRFERELHCSDAVVAHLVAQCHDAALGARQLTTVFNRKLLSPVSQQLLAEPSTAPIFVSVHDGELLIQVERS